MQHIRSLSFNASGVVDAGSLPFANLKELQELCLSGPGIDDAFLEHVPALPGLRTLSFMDTKVTDRGLKAIERFLKLEKLHLPANISEAGFEHVRKLIHLRDLSPLGNITDRGLACLQDVTQLEELDLTRRPITDEDCAACSAWESCESSCSAAQSHRYRVEVPRRSHGAGRTGLGSHRRYRRRTFAPEGMTKLKMLGLSGDLVTGAVTSPNCRNWKRLALVARRWAMPAWRSSPGCRRCGM